MYHYAGNNPVKYVDPDGHQDLYSFLYNMFEQSGGSEGAEYIMKNDCSVNFACTAEAALNGDDHAQQIMKVAAKGATADGLETTADTAAVVSEVTGDLALATAIIKPDVSVGLGKISTISSIVEAGARELKAEITNDSNDKKKAHKATAKATLSFLLGNGVGKASGKLGNGTSNLMSNVAGKITEKVVDKACENKNQEVDE